MIFKSEHLILFSLFPLIGLISSYLIPLRINKPLAIFLVVLTLPIITGYDYCIDWLYEFNLTLILAIGFHPIISSQTQIGQKILVTTVLTFCIFIPLGVYAYLDAFAGNQYIEQKIKKEGYEIRHIRDQGFSGRPAFYYELFHAPLNGLFIKSLNEHGIELDDCIIKFKSQSVEINNCK